MKTLKRSKIEEAKSIIRDNVEDKDAVFHLRDTLQGELMEIELDNLFSTIEEINGKHSKKTRSLTDLATELANLGKPKKRRVVRRKRRRR